MITVNVKGYRFVIENAGWRQHERARDGAMEALENAMNRMPVGEIAALHESLRAGAEYPDEACQLCSQAVWSQVATGWHDPSAVMLSLSARA